MALKESEAIVLRTYPLRESDLLVTLFTRSEGKVRGVARAAKKSKKRFGGALEPLTYVKAYYDDRERQELARLDSCEVLESPLASEVSYPRAVALGLVAELLDELLPDREANDSVFRLSLSVLAGLRGPDVWMPVTYFELWMTRLMGLLPDLAHCIACGEALVAGETSFNAYADGLFCRVHRPGNASELSAESWQTALRMLRAPVTAFAGEPWPRRRGQDLRRFALQALERHLERKLKSAEMLLRL